AGTVRPGHSPGTIRINGNYTQTGNGTLTMEIAGLQPGSQYDQLLVSGNASLAGTLKLSWLNGYLPNDGDTFQLMNYYSENGAWQVYSGFSPATPRYVTGTLTPSSYLVTAHLDTSPPQVAFTSP